MCPSATPSTAALWIVPGARLVLLLVQLDKAGAVLAVRPGRFLDGLRAARDLMSFSALQREEAPLEELLPWSGNV